VKKYRAQRVVSRGESMPVIHEREDRALYIIARIRNSSHCTWQLTFEGEQMLRSFGLASEGMRISLFSLSLLKKHKLIFTNNSGLSEPSVDVRLSSERIQALPFNEKISGNS